MNHNLHAHSMQQSIYKNLEQNPSLMKILAKKCCALGLPAKQGINIKWDVIDRDVRESL